MLPSRSTLSRILATIAALTSLLVSADAMPDRDAALRAYQQRDFSTAFKEWGILAVKGDAEAQFRLGAMYEYGEGVPAQPTKAIQWYRRAADQEYGPAQYALGIVYAQGQGVLQDYIEAHMWLNLASSSGDPHAASERDKLAEKMSPAQIDEAQHRARDWISSNRRAKFFVTAWGVLAALWRRILEALAVLGVAMWIWGIRQKWRRT